MCYCVFNSDGRMPDDILPWRVVHRPSVCRLLFVHNLRYFSCLEYISFKLVHDGYQIGLYSVCVPGGTTYDSYGYRGAILCIFMENAIFPQIFNRFNSNLYTTFTRWGVYYCLLQVAQAVIFQISWLFNIFNGHFSAKHYFSNNLQDLTKINLL